MRLFTFLLLPLALLSIIGCETVHTGVLGDIDTGAKPSGALNVGDTYNDPKGRFSLTITDSRNLVARRTSEGVVLEGKDLDRGDVIYAVLVYEIPDTVTGTDQQVLRATWNGLVSKAASRGGSLTAVDTREFESDGLACLEVYYRSQQGANSLKRGYISRFVKKGGRVYNLYYSYVSMYQDAFDNTVYSTPESFSGLKEPSAKFFAGVRLE